MSYKSDFLWRLTLRIESAQRRVTEEPGNLRHEMYVKSLRLLYRDLDAMPEDHLLFKNWGRERWAPAALSDSAQAHMTPAATESIALRIQKSPLSFAKGCIRTP